MTNNPNKVNKALNVAKEINGEVQSLVLKMFAQAECTDQLKAENPTAYYEKSNLILSALVGCAAQMALGDGLPRYKLAGKLASGSLVAWDLFLHNNPFIATKVQAEKEAKQAAYAAQEAVDASETDEDESEEDSDED